MVELSRPDTAPQVHPAPSTAGSGVTTWATERDDWVMLRTSLGMSRVTLDISLGAVISTSYSSEGE